MLEFLYGTQLTKKYNSKDQTGHNHMKKALIAVLICTISLPLQTDAQVLKRLKKTVERAAERTLQERADREASKATDKALDEVLSPEEKARKEAQKKTPDTVYIEHSIPAEQSSSSSNSRENTNSKSEESTEGHINEPTWELSSAKDFERGEQVLVYDRFEDDFIGDFPVTWNTNSSGEVVSLNNESKRWLKMSGAGLYTPDEVTIIPNNSTVEFDLLVSQDFNYYSAGFWIDIVHLEDRVKAFTRWNRFPQGQNGVRVTLHPLTAHGDDNRGSTSFINYLAGEEMIKNDKAQGQFSNNKRMVHVALWRQESRLRVYLNDEKVWDLPRAFGSAQYNGLVFGVTTKPDEFFCISDLRLAEAGVDKRHALLSDGYYSTSNILFETNSSTLKSSSHEILDEIGQLMVDNAKIKISITGHTDSDGTEEANVILSQQRAHSVKEYLSNHFPIAGLRIETEGKGESSPIADNATEEGKTKNRRVEFKVIE